MLEEIDAVYFEEPCPFDHLEDTKRVADALTIPVAGGEQEFSQRRFRWMITNRSHAAWISASRWLETTTVRPWRPRLISRSRISTIPAGSRPLVGSSRIRIFGECRIA